MFSNTKVLDHSGITTKPTTWFESVVKYESSRSVTFYIVTGTGFESVVKYESSRSAKSYETTDILFESVVKYESSRSRIEDR